MKSREASVIVQSREASYFKLANYQEEGVATQDRSRCNINSPCHLIAKEESVQRRLDEIKKSIIFCPGIGDVIGYEAELQLKDEYRPVFRKNRSVPFALKDKIEATLDQMEDSGILRRVDHSQFASPVVPVLKDDQTVRICGDYKSTLNPALETKQYPLPSVEECFAPMAGGMLVTRLDIRQAYNNMRLRESDQKLTTMNTSKGLYAWTRLPYGVSSSTAIFQSTMDRVLQGMSRVACRVDDIILTGKDNEEHLTTLEEVIHRLETANFRCNVKKTKFMEEEVTFLGYIVNRHGVRPAKDKVETLLKAKYPETLDQLISFLGGVNYYARFIRNLSTIEEPLNRLRRGEPWEFGETEKKAFDKLKAALASSEVVIPYDPTLPVKVDTDASSTGLGAVISHVLPDGTERPIEFASRTLNSAERKYSQIEKEALSLVWGVKRFHKYVYARKFQLVTDHQPLIFILKQDKSIPEMGASRITRWAITLSSYQYEIVYRSTRKHCNADLCSRFPLEADGEEDTGEDGEVADVFYQTFAEKPVINFISIRKFTDTDPTLSKVRRFVLEGWESKLERDRDYLKPYFQRKDELSVERGCVLWGSRVIVPEKLRNDVLELLHVTHQGIVAVKAMARYYIWWPKMNEDIERITRECTACQDSQRKPARSTPHPWEAVERPWERIHADFAGPEKGSMWLIVIDAYTRWIEVCNMKTRTTTEATTKELRRMFATFGLPAMFVSDNGPQFVSQEMKDFLKSNGIVRVAIPTYSPNTNGFVERAVQSFKSAMEKAGRESSDIDKCLSKWLLHHRNTPNSTTGRTPADMMFGRPTRTLLSLLDPLTNKSRENRSVPVDRKLRSFIAGEKVRVYDTRSEEWYPGIVTEKEGCKVYIVETRKGTERRHLDHLVSAVDRLEIDWPETEPKSRERKLRGEPLHTIPVSCPDQVVPEQIPESMPQIPLSPTVPALRARQPVISLSKTPYPLVPRAERSTEPAANVENPVRRSTRNRPDVERLGYEKLGGS